MTYRLIDGICACMREREKERERERERERDMVSERRLNILLLIPLFKSFKILFCSIVSIDKNTTHICKLQYTI